MGWHSGNNSGNAEHKTGIDVNVDTDSDGEVDLTATNKVKNIYDMAGNVREWTMEANSTHSRVGRGCDYGGNASNFPASARVGGNAPINVGGGLGFRFALYIR